MLLLSFNAINSFQLYHRFNFPLQLHYFGCIWHKHLFHQNKVNLCLLLRGGDLNIIILFQKMPKSNFQQYQEFQDYTNYIDTSDVMLGFYKNQSGSGLEKYYLMIEEWLNMETAAEDNKPLVIQADGGVGKKTLLVKWYEYHQSLKATRKNNDLIILHFATTGGNNSNYFYAIYRILIKLREELNIDQKVELHQQKLRKYFAYWLDVCNQRIQNQAIKNLDVLYNKIILVFEGIDYFMDRNNGKEGNIAFWLPKYFPKNVKVIVTADRESQSMKYFTKLGCQKVNIPYDINIMKSMIRSHLQKKLCIQGETKNDLLRILDDGLRKTDVTSLFVKSYLHCLLPQKLDYLQLAEESSKKLHCCVQKIDKNKLKQVRSVDQLFDYLLDFWGNALFSHQDQFKQLISLLISTQKGLTRGEILSITKMDPEQLKLFITIFRPFLMNFKELWMIKNDSFKKSIFTKYDFIPTQINEKIADTLKKTPNSVRKLQQETFQLYSAGNYFKLKQVISDIENFLLLFNPYTKYDLCRYWQKLQERSFDPVIEYNKAIEGFQMHYHPTSDDLFRIITQISRFLREFSDFETYYTPEFRHPKLIGNSKELQDIGILGQFRNLALCEQDEPQESNAQPNYEQHEETAQNQEQKKLKKKLKEMYDKIEQGKHIKKPNSIEVDNTNKNKVKPKKDKEARIQQLNVQVKSNENYFREHYYNQIKGFLEKVSLEGQKQHCGTLDNEKEQDYQQSEEEIESNNLVAKIKNIEKEKSKPEDFKDLKNLYAKTVVEEFELNQKPPTNYYYKRWIWMQFPWVCMTMKCDYSDKLRKCFTSPTSYMSVAEERQFTIQALKIALQAKKKKQAILQKVEDVPKLKKTKASLNSLNGSLYDKLSNRQNSFNGKPPVQDSFFQKAKKSKRVEQLSFVTHSFLSLHNLSKQIDNINGKDQTKNSVFITAENGDYSRLLHSFHKKNNKASVCDLNGTKQGLLPRIKQNANKQMMKELEELQKNNQSIRKEMDSYLYKNKILAKRLKELKIIQYNNQSQLKNEKKIEQKKQKIKQIEQKIQKVKFQYAFSLLEHQRLNVLIKICRINKTHNEQAIPDLVLQCNNFKKMIKSQSESIQQLKKKTDQIKKLTKKFIANCCERIQNEASLQRQIHQTLRNRQNFQSQVIKYDEMITEELQQKRKELQELHHNSANLNHESMHDKPKKNFHSEQDQFLQAYKELERHIDLQDDNYLKDPAYQKLLDGLAKKRQFEAVLEERKMHLEELQKKYEEQKRQLETLNKAKEEAQENLNSSEANEEEQGDPITSEDIEDLQKELNQKKRILGKTTGMKLSCLGMLNTLYSRLGLQQQSKLTITSQFLQKIEQAKVLSKVQTC